MSFLRSRKDGIVVVLVYLVSGTASFAFYNLMYMYMFLCVLYAVCIHAFSPFKAKLHLLWIYVFHFHTLHIWRRKGLESRDYLAILFSANCIFVSKSVIRFMEISPFNLSATISLSC